ncbi:MAG: hypothetical protein AAF437_15540 [Pseudomonadota bacterium]
MSAKDRSPINRLIVLAALMLAAGLFALRAYDVFGAPKSDPVGSVLEQELTYLLEPITGPGKVRVSITGSSPKSVLVMIDGDIATDLRPLRVRIELILASSMAFDPERDRLNLSQFPFARGVGTSLTAFQIAELTGLGLLVLMLALSGFSPPRHRPVEARSSIPEPAMPREHRPTSQLAAPARPINAELHQASTLAEANPNETAQLVRNWMSYAEE